MASVRLAIAVRIACVSTVPEMIAEVRLTNEKK